MPDRAAANSLLDRDFLVKLIIKKVMTADTKNGERSEVSRLKKFIKKETITAPKKAPIGALPVPKNR